MKGDRYLEKNPFFCPLRPHLESVSFPNLPPTPPPPLDPRLLVPLRAQFSVRISVNSAHFHL